MKAQEQQYDVGVLVARFQEDELHKAHRELLDYVVGRHSKVLLVLGLAPVMGTQNNPLDYPARRQMVRESYSDMEIAFIKDVNNDRLWSKRLDQVIESHLTPNQSAVIYGGRDSFIAKYSGRFPTQEMVQKSWVSGTSRREKIAKSATIASPEFRAGVIWAAHSRYPTTYPTVDVAVFDEREEQILLGRKPYEAKFRLIGGFAEPESERYEHDARREVEEEAHVSISDPIYITSQKIDDWRYRNEVDKIKTLLFRATYLFGAPRPDDDLEEVRWFNVEELRENLPDLVVENHQYLIELVLTDHDRRAIEALPTT